jgi:hypothetical protein
MRLRPRLQSNKPLQKHCADAAYAPIAVLNCLSDSRASYVRFVPFTRST